MLYSLARSLLFTLDAEVAHDLTLSGLRLLDNFHLVRPCQTPLSATTNAPAQVMGLTFPNRVGLAAGLDKDGDCIDGLAALGFGFIEVGTVTPRPQTGNPRPRLFRLEEHHAIINRMGFNNHGIDRLVQNIQRAQYRGILGINIGKNFDTPIEDALQDYLICLQKAYAYASYITVNISSPNTQDLRQLQEGAALNPLLSALKAAQARLADQHGRYVPLVLKISPDLDDSQVANIAAALRQHRIDGVIAANTSTSRQGVEHLPTAREAGGLSGAPIFGQTTAVLALLAQHLAGEIPLIGVGGIMDGAGAQAKLQAGASLVQIYSGLIYRGPKLIQEAICSTL